MATDGKKSDIPFGKAFGRLEEIAELLENPKLELEEAEKLIEESRELEKLCRVKLSDQELKVSKLFEEKGE